MGVIDSDGHPETYKYLARAIDEVRVYIRKLKLNMDLQIFRDQVTDYPDSYLFTVSYHSMAGTTIRVPVAILTRDGGLRFLIESGSVYLRVGPASVQNQNQDSCCVSGHLTSGSMHKSI